MSYWCYILKNKDDKYKKYTYNGFTVDPWKRIRQHNGEIKGGAKYTQNKGTWEYCMLMTGFKTASNALSCEWRIRKPENKKRSANYTGPIGRIKSLNIILSLKHWTTKSEDIDNNECNYTLYVIDYLHKYLNLEKIPKNIKIIQVPKFDKLYIERNFIPMYNMII